MSTALVRSVIITGESPVGRIAEKDRSEQGCSCPLARPHLIDDTVLIRSVLFATCPASSPFEILCCSTPRNIQWRETAEDCSLNKALVELIVGHSIPLDGAELGVAAIRSAVVLSS